MLCQEGSRMLTGLCHLLSTLALSFYPASGRVSVPDAIDESNILEYVSLQNAESFTQETIYSYEGDARYVLISPNVGLPGIYDLENNEFTIRDMAGLTKHDSSLQGVLLHIDGEPNLFWTDGDSAIQRADSGSDLFGSSFQVTKIVPGESEYEDSLLANAVKADNYEYFLNLNGRYGTNGGKTCTMVAIQMMMGYYDAFVDDRFVPEKWDSPAYDSGVTSSSSWRDWSCSPGSGSIGSTLYPEDNRMLDHLVDICENNFDSSIENFGTSIFHEKETLEYYLDEIAIGKDDYSMVVAISESPGPVVYLNPAANLIKKAIDAGRPVFANGGGHAVVAFGYDDKYVYVDTGWGYIGRVPLSTYQVASSYDQTESSCNALDFIVNIDHSHSDNYVSCDAFQCSCGYVFPSTHSSMTDIGLPDSYKTYGLSNTLSEGGGETVYSYVNACLAAQACSLRSMNGNASYLQFRASTCSISSLSVTIRFSGCTSYVTSVDVLILNSDGEWVSASTVSLSYSCSSTRIFLSFGEDISGVRISQTNSGSTPSIFLIEDPIWRYVL